MAPAEPTDSELVVRILDGDHELYVEIVNRYQGRLVNFLNRLLRNLEAAHDVAQDVFLKVYKALDRYDPKYKFSTWIFRVAHNQAIDEIRKRRIKWVSLQRRDSSDDSQYEWEIPDHDASPYRDLRNRERGSAIYDAIDGLPEDYRELVVLRHYGELSYDEIAQLKEMPLGTVKNKLFRGRQMLKEQLTEYLGE